MILNECFFWCYHGAMCAFVTGCGRGGDIYVACELRYLHLFIVDHRWCRDVEVIEVLLSMCKTRMHSSFPSDVLHLSLLGGATKGLFD